LAFPSAIVLSSSRTLKNSCGFRPISAGHKNLGHLNQAGVVSVDVVVEQFTAISDPFFQF
jgi:hypothetical protein